MVIQIEPNKEIKMLFNNVVEVPYGLLGIILYDYIIFDTLYFQDVFSRT